MSDRVSVADAAEVLAVAALYDDREPSRYVAEEWARVLNEHGIGAHDAAAAVRQHYAERPDDRVKPGHVVAIARLVIRDRRERERTAEILAIEPDRPREGSPEALAVIGRLRAKIAEEGAKRDRRRAVEDADRRARLAAAFGQPATGWVDTSPEAVRAVAGPEAVAAAMAWCHCVDAGYPGPHRPVQGCPRFVGERIS